MINMTEWYLSALHRMLSSDVYCDDNSGVTKDLLAFLEFSLCKTKIEILCDLSDTQSVIELTDEQHKQLEQMLAERLHHKPISKIFGYNFFYGRKFLVNEHVLDPRQETEKIVEIAKKFNDNNKITSILDLGTGSGCLIVSLTIEIKPDIAYAIDISNHALEIAAKNIMQYNLQEKIQLIQSDWYSCFYSVTSYEELNDKNDMQNFLVSDFDDSANLKTEKCTGVYRKNILDMHKKAVADEGTDVAHKNNVLFDLIVSNPPYLSRSEEVGQELAFDPDISLYCNNAATEHYIEIICEAKRFLTSIGVLILEVPKSLISELQPIFLTFKFHKIFETYVDNIVFIALSDYAHSLLCYNTVR